MAIVTLRYWAAAKEAAGIAEETINAGTLAEALAAARGKAGAAGPAGAGGSARAEGSAGADGSPGPDTSAGADGSAGPNPRLRAVLARSSFLIDGEPVGTRPRDSVVLADASVIEVLPPFAGG